MSRSVEALVKPHMLLWARNRSGFDTIGAAKRCHVAPERLISWEAGDARPTISQALALAEIYKIPFSAFYLNEPPTDFSINPADFRRLRNSQAKSWIPELTWEWRQANMRRQIAVDLSADESSGRFNANASQRVTDDVAKVAEMWRGRLNVSAKEQSKWAEQDEGEPIKAWKAAIEAEGVLVCMTDYATTRIDPDEFRGFALSGDRFPVIVLNASDSKRGQAFTLLHELGHLLLGESGISNGWSFGNLTPHATRIETWCNAFAAGVLMPAETFQQHEVVEWCNRHDSWAEVDIELVAHDFAVSKESVVRRALTLGMVTREFYEEKRAAYSQAFRDARLERRNNPAKDIVIMRHRMVVRNHGKPFVRLVFQAHHDQKIGITDVAHYLAAKIPDVIKMERELYY